MVTAMVINACTGRMGKELIDAILSDSGSDIAAAIARTNHPLVGTDLGYIIGANPQGVFISSDVSTSLEAGRVLIDFSLPEHSIATLEKAVFHRCPMVIGTTGFSEAQKEKISEASKIIPIVFSANYSVGVNSLIGLVKQATKLLGQKADIEIFEAHHKHKIDAPSGTAIAIGEAIAETKGVAHDAIAVIERAGKREKGSLGYSVMRAGDIIGTHEVVFALNGEMLTLRHEAQSRQCFAQGAVQAAKWLSGQSAGVYSMQDVLGLA